MRLGFTFVQALVSRNSGRYGCLASATTNHATNPKLKQLELGYGASIPEQKTLKTSISTAERLLPETPL
jgi:hypothetical protein